MSYPSNASLMTGRTLYASKKAILDPIRHVIFVRHLRWQSGARLWLAFWLVRTPLISLCSVDSTRRTQHLRATGKFLSTMAIWIYADCVDSFCALSLAPLLSFSPLRTAGFPSSAVVQQQNEQADAMQKAKGDKQRKEAESVVFRRLQFVYKSACVGFVLKTVGTVLGTSLILKVEQTKSRGYNQGKRKDGEARVSHLRDGSSQLLLTRYGGNRVRFHKSRMMILSNCDYSRACVWSIRRRNSNSETTW